MATRSLTIAEDAYDKLRSHKRPDESFTDVILRLSGDERDIWQGFGAYEGTGEDVKAELAEDRQAWNEDAKEREDELFGQ